MAVSPKGSRRAWLFPSGPGACAWSVALLSGFGCCLIIALTLHTSAPSVGQHPAEGARPRPRRRAAAGARTAAADARRTADTQRSSLGWAAAEAELATAEAVGGGQLFGLIPRPASLEPLAEGTPTRPPGAGLASPTLWRLVDAGRHQEVPLRAALGEFERLLNASAKELQPSSAEGLPEGGVAVALLGEMGEAYDTCMGLVGLAVEDKSPLAAGLAAPRLSEWHVAILWEGRLAVCAVEPAGAFRFAATLRQMLDHRLQPSAARPQGLFQALPPFVLEDWPRYEWRGLQLDCVRHFMPVEFIKRYLSAMAYYKANAFHWHLTDDQAWRLYIPSRPVLVGSNKWSPEYYSTEDVQEIVDFAARLFITVLPTIETPGHCLAALAAYPELACQGESFEVPKTRVGTYDDIMCVGKKVLADFARDVFEEVARLFPGPFIHVGGDEVLTTKWSTSKHAKAFAGSAGLQNLGPDLMEAWYCHVSQLLKGLNRTIVMWDDHFAQRGWSVTRKCPEAARDWVVQAWKMEAPVGGPDNSGALSPFWRFRTIASPMKSVYLDYPVASIDYNKTLDWHLGGPKDTVLGGCANMWTEDSEPKDVGGKVYPRYLGIAERLWNGDEPGRPQARRPRTLDAASREAAQRHCAKGGPLLQDLGFACGKFEQTVNGRSPMWLGARVRTSIDLYGEAFSPERAVDDDQESYFWGVAPKEQDFFEVTFQDAGPKLAMGKWMGKLAAYTGAKDRPGDQLDKGVLQVVQWLPSKKDHEKYKLHVRTVAHFSGGNAIADEHRLSAGPVVAVKIVCREYQTKWMALTEITAEEAPAKEHPTEEEVMESMARWRHYQASALPKSFNFR